MCQGDSLCDISNRSANIELLDFAARPDQMLRGEFEEINSYASLKLLA